MQYLITKFDEIVKKIKNDVQNLDIEDLVRGYLSNYYAENVINEALKSYEFKVIDKKPGDTGVVPPPPTSPLPPPPHPRGKIFFKVQWYNQTRFVLAVVKAYVRDNPSVTYHGLRVAFPDSLQGSWGVISTPKEVRVRTEDPNKRYHMDDLILLADGTNVCVCSQWGRGLNTERFIAHTRKLGYTVFDPMEKK